MKKEAHLRQTRNSAATVSRPSTINWNQFLDYVNSYDPAKHGNNNPVTIQEDIIYGIGICSSNEFNYADGYRKFKDILIKRWSK